MFQTKVLQMFQVNHEQFGNLLFALPTQPSTFV